MTIENLIFIKGGAYKDVKKALKQWVDLYSNDLQNGLTFELYKNGHGKHIIKADKNLDNESFFYLVNYLYYPENIEYKIDIEGFTKGKDNNKLHNKDLLVYISPTDKDYDNVIVMTSEYENFKVDFGSNLIEIDEKREFIYPSNLVLENPETITVNHKETGFIKDKNIEKRFNKLALTALCFKLIDLILILTKDQLFFTFSFFSDMLIGIWFVVDYEMLQSNRNYLYSLGIAFGYFLFIFAFNETYNNIQLYYGSLFPLAFLIIQKPTRILFKTFLKREPVVEKPAPTFWDGVYMFFIFLSSLFLSIKLSEIFI